MRHTITGFVEAVARVAVACEYHHLVPSVLEANGGIDDEALCSADAQIGMQEYYGLATVLLLFCHAAVWPSILWLRMFLGNSFKKKKKG
jgi:hypothetical protein